MHIVLFFCNVLYFTATKSFLIIETKLHNCITLKTKHLRKTILLYIIVTVSRGTYLNLVQSKKRKFVSSAANTCKSHMFDSDFVNCSSFFCILWSGPILLS